MTDKEIQKGNKLIAEFMGWEKGATEEMYDFPENFSSFLVDEYHEILPKSMKFHSSWNWLMPVVDKIEDLPYTNVYTGKTYLGEFHIEITHETPGYKHNQVNKVVFVKDKNLSKLQSYYKAVIEFIKWYNTQKI